MGGEPIVHILLAEQPRRCGKHQQAEQQKVHGFEWPERTVGDFTRERIVRQPHFLRPGSLLDERRVATPGPIGQAFVADTVEVPFVVVTVLRAIVAQHHRTDVRIRRATVIVHDHREHAEQNAEHRRDDKREAENEESFGNERTHFNCPFAVLPTRRGWWMINP